MKRKTVVTAAVLTALGLGAGGFAAGKATPSFAGPEATAASLLAGASGHRGWRHGAGGRGGHVCAAARGERLEHVIDFVEGFMAFTPEQETAWQDLAASLREGRTQVQSACAELAQAEDPASAPAALERAELFLTTGLGVVRQLRPAFDAFYASLSETQRQALDRLVAGAHRRS